MAKYQSTLTGAQMESALSAMPDSEAYAIGTRNGVAVTSGDVAYHNNSKYWAQQAQSAFPESYATGAVRGDIAQTAMTDAWRAQARENIEAGSIAQVGSLGNAIGMRGWNQLIPDGLTAYSSNVSISGHQVSWVSGTGTISAFIVEFNVKAGHKYSITKPLNSGQLYSLTSGISTISFYSSTDNEVIVTYDGTSGDAEYLYQIINVTSEGFDSFCPQIIDLTALFGSGNEPSTVAEFRAMFPADYYPHCSGQFADLLWTGSGSAVTSVSLDLSEYSKVQVLLKQGSSGTNYASVIADKGITTTALGYVSSAIATNDITVSDTGITFTSGSTLIPYKIYGIR